MLEKLKKKYKSFLTVFCFFLKNSFYSNLAPVLIHSRISAGELIILAFTIVLVSFIAAYLLGLFLAKTSTLFNKKKPQEKIYIRAFRISMICLLVHNVISFIVDISSTSFIISIVTTPFLMILLPILFIAKNRKRDDTFDNFLESSKNNEEK
jgi:uncharacterized protein YacL